MAKKAKFNISTDGGLREFKAGQIYKNEEITPNLDPRDFEDVPDEVATETKVEVKDEVIAAPVEEVKKEEAPEEVKDETPAAPVEEAKPEKPAKESKKGSKNKK